jgi:phosphate:Na+ symporter
MVGVILGGIGLFLLGMTLMTSGMQAVAGDRLRAFLQASTRTPARGLLAGAAVTALIQSSSATTLAAIGFVGAGLLTFSQSLGLLYGANLGTTSTAWIIALLGLKIKMDVIALPLIGVGAALKVFGGKRVGPAGLAIAGFGLLFIGIAYLQEGMVGLEGYLDPAAWARSGFLGVLLLVALGIGMTVVMQSSSAAVAMTLAAVHAGSITLEQAALLAIGQNVGTTVKAAIAAAGGTVAARRAAVAHTLFNVGTGAIALLSLPIFLAIVRFIADLAGGEDPAVQLSVFHTLFNLVGVLCFLPITDRFAAFVERIVPERRRGLTRRLVDAGSGVPEVRIEAARRTVLEVMTEVLLALRGLLTDVKGDDPPERRMSEAHEALVATRAWLAPLHTDPTTTGLFRRHVDLLHAIDHLDQLIEACDEVEPAARLRRELELTAVHGLATRLLELPRDGDELHPDAASRAEGIARELVDYRSLNRPRILEQTAAGAVSPLAAEGRLEAIRWAERIGLHVSRALVYLVGAARVNDDTPLGR